LKLKYDKLLSNIAFNYNLRHYYQNVSSSDNVGVDCGGALQLDPGFPQLTPRLVSTLESKI